MPNDTTLEAEPTQRLSEDAQRPPPHRSDLRRGNVLAARYEIQELLGAGGMASVYRAFDRVTEQTIAIKVLEDDRSAARGWVEQLGRELRHARRIKHPNVCPVFDFCEGDGRCFLTMELAPGGTLRDSLKTDARRPLADRLADARAVIDGVAAIHEAGVVHRDLKPENVLRAAEGHLMVSDLGVAIHADLTTHSGGPAGTRSYMAPELVYGEKATKASDVWSLGIVLHEALFGSRPEWAVTRRGRHLRRPDAANGMLARGLLKLCADCLVELPRERIPDAVAVKRRFERLVGGWIRGGWKVSTLAIALSAISVALAVPFVRGRDPRPGRGMVGAAADLGSNSISVFRTDRAMRWCAQLLPGTGATLRLFLERPAEAIDLDVETGRYRSSNLVPEALISGCAQLSPDGQRLLYEKLQPGRGPQVMLSAAPDGRDAAPITDGEGAYWLPSGDAFLYTVDYTRSAVFWLGHGQVPLAASGSGNSRIVYHAVNDRGEIAVLSVRSTPNRAASLEIYGYPQTNLLRSIDLPFVGLTWLQHDSKRNAWQISMRDPARLTRCEVNEDGTCSRLLQSAMGDMLATYRSRLGLVAVEGCPILSSVMTDNFGQRQSYPKHFGVDFTATGDAILSLALDDGRVVIAVQRRGENGPRIISDGPTHLWPAVASDGKSFTYVDHDARTVVQCTFDVRRSSECHAIHREPLGLGPARLSPDGRHLAYTVLDAAGSRLRIIAMNSEGLSRDLSVPGIGRLRWTSPSRLWLCERLQRQWEEIDTIAGIRTGRSLPVPNDADWLNVCLRHPPELADRFSDFEVTTSLRVTQEVRLARDM